MTEAPAKREENFVGTKPVDPASRFDEVALRRWLEANIDGFDGVPKVTQFKGGQSNPSFRIDAGGRAYVVRRKPMGQLLPSAHAVDREYRVTAALHGAGFPVARPLALCRDESVIGSMFYVMDLVDGPIFWSAALPSMQPAERRAVYEAEISTLADLHNLDVTALGLEDFGKPGNYFARQVDRWSRQYRASETSAIESVDRLIAWLPGTVPEQTGLSVVHGDYRLDNLVFAPGESRIAAVLDWELSTIGDPLADLTYFLMTWAMPAGTVNGLDGLDLDALGIPAVDEVVRLYCARTGRTGIPNLDWYLAYNLFRLSAIVQGIAGRVRDGTASNERAMESGKLARTFADLAWHHAVRAGA